MTLPTLPRYTRRPARQLVCPDCGRPVVLSGGLLRCIADEVGPLAVWGSYRIADLVVGPRLRPDCHLTALSCRNRRTRECVRWEVETGRRAPRKERSRAN